MDDEPMWVADHVVAPTLGSAITISETANEFAIKEFEKKTKDDRKRYIDLVEKFVKEIIKDEVKNQLPKILPKEVSTTFTPRDLKPIFESLEISIRENVNRIDGAKEPQRSLKMHWSFLQLDKDLFESYGKKTSKDAEPSRGSKSKESKSRSSKGSKSQSKSSGKSSQAEEPVFETADTEMPLNQGEDLSNTDD
ncbi:hypothetical protein Tco_0658988 [Tanacetum coccineum]